MNTNINSEDVQKMAQLMDKFGAGLTAVAIVFVVFLVLLSIGITVFLKVINNQNSQNEDMRKTQAEQFKQMFELIPSRITKAISSNNRSISRPQLRSN